MKDKPYKSKTPEPPKAEEPLAKSFGSKITFFHSFEEMNVYDHRKYAELIPEQSLAMVTKIRLALHPHLKEPDSIFDEEIYLD